MPADQKSQLKQAPSAALLSLTIDDDDQAIMPLPSNSPLQHPPIQGHRLTSTVGLFVTTLTTLSIAPFHRLVDWFLSYHYVYVLSIHDLGVQPSPLAPSSVYSILTPQQHRVLALFTTEASARIAVTETLSMPEYEGRMMKTAFPELGKAEPGLLLSGCGSGSEGGDRGVVVMVQRMLVRKREV